MKKKIAILLCICLIVFPALCSCGKPTALGIVADMVSACAKAKSFEGTMSSDMTMDVGVSALGGDITTQLTSSTKGDIKGADSIFYIKGSTSLLLGSIGAYDMGVEGYTVIEDSGSTVYSLSGDEWTKRIYDGESQGGSISLDSVIGIFKAVKDANVYIHEETEQYNGQEVYVLDLTLSGDTLMAVAGDSIASTIEQITGDAADNQNVDTSEISAAVTLKVYKDTKLPAEITMDFGNSFQGYVDSMTENISSGINSIISVDMTIEIQSHTITIGFDSYNTVDSLEVPQEALDAPEYTPSESGGVFDSLLPGGIGG